MKRRDVLKTVAFGLPAITALGPRILFAEASASRNIKKLNLIVEGPFICLLHDDHTEIFAPRVEKHLYDINQQAAEEGTYRLDGARGITGARNIQYILPEGAEAFRLSLEQFHLSLNRTQAPYFSFVAPLPKQIVAVLSRGAEIIDAFGQRRNVTMPTSYAFVYDVEDSHGLRLDGYADWNPEKRLAREQAVNLSVATGLPMGVQDPHMEHYHMALATLRTYLPGLKLDVLSVSSERQTAQLAGYPGPEARSSLMDCEIMPLIISLLTPKPQPQPPKPPATN